MKKLIKELMLLCPGRLSIQIDYHKLFNETAEKYITANPKEFRSTPADICIKMMRADTVIFVQANPVNKGIEAKSYHCDIESALQDCLNQIKLWQPTK